MRWTRAGFVGSLLLGLVIFVAPGAHASTQGVSITGDSAANFAFSPAQRSATVGDTVLWANQSSGTHRIVSDAVTEPYDSGNVAPGGSFTHTFPTTGTFAYHCSIHPAMQGSVIVSTATTTIATTTTIKPTTTTVKATTTTKKPSSTTSTTIDQSSTSTSDQFALDTSSTESTTSTTAASTLTIKKKSSGSGAAIGLVVALGLVLGGGGYVLYRMRAARRF